MTQDLNQLERLQRQRKGEFVPAPIALDVNVSGLDQVGQDDVVHGTRGRSKMTVVTGSVDPEGSDPCV